jgi:high-affinity nickel-transport protein
VYVLATLVRGRERPKSRAALVLAGWRWLTGRQAAREVNGPACLGVGVIHGLGAETPSQLALFLLAAHLGGVQRGFVGLGFFLAGLLLMNTLMTASAAGVFRVARGWYPVLTGLTAVYSFGIGVVFLLGASGNLKTIAG